MTARDTWDDEMDDHEDREDDKVDSGAAATPKAEGEEGGEDTRDMEQGASKQQQQADDSRARRAQRTRRIKLNPNNSAAGASAGTPPGQNSPPAGQNGPATQNAASPLLQNSPPTPSNAVHQAEQGAMPKATSTKTAKAPGRHQPAAPNPGLPAAVVTGFTSPDHDVVATGVDDEVVEVDEEESSHLFDSLSRLWETMKDGMRRLCQAGHGLVRAVIRILMFPALLGGLLYLGALYVIGTYILGTDDTTNLGNFEENVIFVLLSSGWTVFPVFAAFVVVHFAKNIEKHQQFLYESVIDAVLQVFNGLILAAHGSPECIVWINAVFIISAVFRMMYWSSLFLLSNKWQQVFKTPAVLNCVILSVNNLGASLRHSALRIMGEGGELPPDQTAATTPAADDDSQTTNGQDLLSNPSMCRILESVFCDVDQSH